MKHLSGHESSLISKEEMEKIAKDFEGFRTRKLVEVSPGGWCYPEGFQKHFDKIYNFKFRSSDIILMTWLKSGTHWTREILWTMKHNQNLDSPDMNNCADVKTIFFDSDILGSTPQERMDPDTILQAFNKYCPGKDPTDGVYLPLLEAIPDPRIIKTHLPLSLANPSLLDTAKVVYVARNPKDIIVSFHHHCKLFRNYGYVGTFDDFVKYFVKGRVHFGPYWLHVKEAWERRNHPNLHFMFYEDMKEDPLREIKKLDAFLNTNLTQAQMEGIVEFTSFEAMKDRGGPISDIYFKKEVMEKDGGFLRKGESGDWKSKLTPELDEFINQWIRKNLDDLGIPFKYEV